ncbi:chaperone [Kosakonia phage Kc263]|uniref:Chaperone n=1 Tax=Kosakonia phage Kc263 TaxID=2863194 RepID=A0AAE7WI42_9CAUD|nr:chaperone [Kosakonia phage Kc263]QYN80074.1 chaperone [Kosakonia phage Kc263]
MNTMNVQSQKATDMVATMNFRAGEIMEQLVGLSKEDQLSTLDNLRAFFRTRLNRAMGAASLPAMRDATTLLAACHKVRTIIQ